MTTASPTPDRRSPRSTSAAFGDVAIFKRSVDALVRDFRNSQRMPGVDRIWVPGERSHETRLRRTALAFP